MPKRGISRISMENLFSHSTEKFHRGTLLCFTKFLVSKTFMDKGEGGASRFSVKNILSHSAEKFRTGTLQCVTNFGYRKILCFRELCHDFVSKIFVSLCPKISSRNPSDLCFRKCPVAKKFMDKKGEYQGFPSKVFRLTVPKNFVGETFNVSFFSGNEKSYASEGYVTILCRKFLSHCAEKFRRGTFLICVSENIR